uniref:Uncharacterized protein n=1 Tax=Anguilla anguilla TaxID=7936 RepID=A0A0E9W9A3_ANGAN
MSLIDLSKGEGEIKLTFETQLLGNIGCVPVNHSLPKRALMLKSSDYLLPFSLPTSAGLH